MESDWALIEFRPGRFAKVTSDGTVIGIASEAEARAWFAARGWDGEAETEQPLPTLSLHPPTPALDSAATGLPPPPSWMTGRSQDASLDRADDQAPIPPAAAEATPELDPTVDRPEPADPRRKGTAAPSPEQAVESARRDLATGIAPEPLVTEPEASDRDEWPEEDEMDEWADGDGRLESGIDSDFPPEEDQDLALDEEVLSVSARQPEDGLAASERPPSSDSAGWWLWVDPRQEPGYSPVTFDLAAFLRRALQLFQTKTWSGGQKPARLAAHPDQVARGLQDVADELGLEVVSDSKVTLGTYMLGLEQRKAD